MPSVNGFAVGQSIMNNTAYVGRAFYKRDLQRISRLQVETVAGVYLGPNGDDVGIDPEYLVVPEGCSCRFMPVARALRREGLVSCMQRMFLVGRKDLGDGYVAVTEVDRGDLNQTYVGRNFFSVQDAATELLVCENESA